MKRKILSILFGSMIILSLIGCKPSENFFIGTWTGEFLSDGIYTINKDKTWHWRYYVGLGERNGTWILNDDWTITLIDEYGNETIAKYESEKIYDKDDMGNELDSFTSRPYLVINNEKFYKNK